MHSLYEEARVLNKNSEEYFAVENKMKALSNKLERPDKIEDLKNYKR